MNKELMIENLELCARLMENCAKTMREMCETIEKYDRDYRVLAEYANKQQVENSRLDGKLTNILNGIGVNK